MPYLLAGAAALLLLFWLARTFSRASVGSIKVFGAWLLGLGGAAAIVLLVLSGRGGFAFFLLPVFGPLAMRWLRRKVPGMAGAMPGAGRAPSSKMTRAEAYQVLGLQPGASKSDIQVAYVRLMRAAHPDSGGSDWLAARINQARDVLTG